LFKIYVHIIFSTKRRFPFLAERPIRAEMHSYLGAICNAMNCRVITVGGIADHVHILCLLSKNLAACDLIGEIKRRSSKWVKTKGRLLRKFAWQSGYGVFSVDQSRVEIVRHYILNQEDHHRHKSFQEEFRNVLKNHDVQFDERFVWD
jgi:putative transposase